MRNAWGKALDQLKTNGQVLASVSTDQTLRLWDVEKGIALTTLHGHTKAVNGVAFAPDGNRIFTTSSDQTLRIWSADNANWTRTKWIQQGEIYALAFGSGGGQVFVGGNGGNLRLLEADSGRQLAGWNAHGNSLNATAISSNTKRAVSVRFHWTAQFAFSTVSRHRVRKC